MENKKYRNSAIGLSVLLWLSLLIMYIISFIRQFEDTNDTADWWMFLSLYSYFTPLVFAILYCANKAKMVKYTKFVRCMAYLFSGCCIFGIVAAILIALSGELYL